MRSLVVKVLGLAIVFTSVAFTAPSMDWSDSQIVQQTRWTLEKNKSDIEVYTQRVTLEDGFKTRRLKGVFEVNAPMAAIASYLKDGDKIQDWMQGALSSKTLMSGQNKWTNYVQFNLPWPFDDQDCVVEFEPQINTSNQTVISFRSRPEVLSTQKGFKRMEHFYGYWKLQKRGAQTLVEYTAYTKSERLVPAFIQDPIVLNSFWNSLYAFQQEVR